jgi:hypothetical protein
MLTPLARNNRKQAGASSRNAIAASHLIRHCSTAPGPAAR